MALTESTSDRIVRVGIAGLGRSGWNIHVTTLEQLPEQFRVVAVCDVDPARRSEAETRLSCRSYAEFGELVRDREIDLVVVAGPSHLHSRQAIHALRAGKDVLVEKPFATSLREA
ncbi:MAG TPA: Gfo/Idh/MocA family oxidoreductase, partial [Chloroflexota bacterium]|nr:Gfo/Idh/MocA family oxidoreductase [Chloroflexota bacterium]